MRSELAPPRLTSSEPVIDWMLARRQTSGCNRIIHLNNAGASLMPDCVVEAAIKHLRDEARMGAYEAAESATRELEHVYETCAKLLNCSVSEISIVENASRAWSLIFAGIKFEEGNVVVTSNFEYANNYMAILQAKHRYGLRVVVAQNTPTGELSMDSLMDIIVEHGRAIRLISITHVPTNNGVVNSVNEIGRLVRETKVSGLLHESALYILDACQSAGQIFIDVQEGGFDILTTCSRKYLRGPRGIGLLYVRGGRFEQRRSQEPMLLDVRAAGWTSRDGYDVYDDGRRFETWETNVSAKIAFGVAVDHARGWGISNIEKYTGDMAEKLRTLLHGVSRIRLHDTGTRRCGIVSFSVAGSEPSEVRTFLANRRINVSISERALTRLDMENRQLDNVLRASLHYYNCEAELDLFVDALGDFCRRHR